MILEDKTAAIIQTHFNTYWSNMGQDKLNHLDKGSMYSYAKKEVL